MPWQAAILLHGLLSGIRNIFLRLLGKSRHDLSVNALLYSFCAVFLLGILYVIVTKSSVDLELALEYKVFLAIGGALFATLNYLVIKLFRMVSASVGSLMSLLNPLAVLILAIMFTDESLSIQQLVGAFVLLGAVFLAEQTGSKKKKRYFNLSKSMIIAIIVAILFALATLNEKYLLDSIGVPTYLVFGWGSQLLATLVIVWIFKADFKKISNNRERIILLSYAFLLAVSGGFFIYSLVHSASVSLTTVSASSKVIITMLLAYIFLRERKRNVLKFLSLVMSVAGLYLLFQ